MTLKLRERAALAEAFRRQGATVKRTSSGWTARTELGTIGWHRSPSSARNDLNLRKDAERIGLTWPEKVKGKGR